MKNDIWISVAAGTGLVGVAIVGAAISVAVFDLIHREQTLDRVDIHGKPCPLYDSVGEKIGSMQDAQNLVEELGGVTNRVCYTGEIKEGAVWYTTGSK